MRLSLIVALDKNGLIGDRNRLPWHLPADLKHFKAVTMNKPVIMGRKTCQSIGRPLTGRRNMVITRHPDTQLFGFEVYTDIESIFSALGDVEEAVVIGGAEVYRLFWDRVTRLYVTLIRADFQGDTWFSPWPLPDCWRLKTSEERMPDGQNAHHMTFMVFEKMENI